jgi:hypothetical protein
MGACPPHSADRGDHSYLLGQTRSCLNHSRQAVRSLGVERRFHISNCETASAEAEAVFMGHLLLSRAIALSVLDQQYMVPQRDHKISSRTSAKRFCDFGCSLPNGPKLHLIAHDHFPLRAR